MLPVLTTSGEPPHCPDPGFTHYNYPKTPRCYQKPGTYATLAFGNVPRFVCNSRGKYFSSQTFSIDYYATLHRCGRMT